MIKENTKRLLNEIPEGVELIAAVKTRSADEILEAIDAGIKIIGQNYIQEAEDIYNLIQVDLSEISIPIIESNSLLLLIIT